MKSDFVSANKIKESFTFNDNTRWIHAPEPIKAAHVFYRKHFELKTIPKRGVLLGMAAGYAEIFCNGAYVAGLSERSYIFNKSYEVYDITSYLQKGMNTVAVLEIGTGEAVRDGFALEILADRATVLNSDGNWLCKRDESIGISDFYLSGVPEIVDGNRIDDAISIDHDDSSWEHASVIGNELLHAPYERFHQSMTSAQTNDIKYPEVISALLNAEKMTGYRLKFESGKGITCAMASFILATEASLYLIALRGAFHGISIDGKCVNTKTKILLSAGRHVLTLAYLWTKELLIQTTASLEFTSPSGAPFLSAVLPATSYRYPWNEYHGRGESDEKANEILEKREFSAFEGLETAPLTPSASDMALSDILFRVYTIPKDGFAPASMIASDHIKTTNDSSGVTGTESFANGGTLAFLPFGKIKNLILDFGEEQVGMLFFTIDAPAGTILELHAFEMITDNGIAYMGDGQTLRYVCRGGKQSYRSVRRRGFRYLSMSVSENNETAVLSALGVIETRYPVPKANFSCSDPTLTNIFQMSVRTAEVCMLDMYVDCPGCEQNPWTGDARVTGKVNLTALGAFDYDAQYLRTIAESLDDGVCRVYRTNNPRYQNRYYLTCACFPTYPDGCIPIWSFQWLLQVYDHYEATGDAALLRELFDAIKEQLSRAEKMINNRGLFDMQGAWNLIEWANNDLTFYGECTANNTMLAYCFRRSAEAALLLGEHDLAAHYREVSVLIGNAVNTYLWNEERRAYIDTARDKYAYEKYVAYMKERDLQAMPYPQFVSQSRVSVQSNTFAVLYGVAPKERRADAMRFLIDNIESGDYIPGTPAKRTFGIPDEKEAPGGYVHIGSPFFLFFGLDALYQCGEDVLALKAQRRDYGKMIEKGLTTCIENFIGKESWPRSVAHAWSASPAIWLLRDVLGVKPIKPGYAEFCIDPHPAFLTEASGTVPTPHGNITVSWHKNADGTLKIECDAPKTCIRRS